MLILPSKPGAKPSKPAEYLALLFIALYIVLGLLFLTRSIPSRESLALASIDPSVVPITLSGTGNYTLIIQISPDTQLRDARVQRDTGDELVSVLAVGKHQVTVSSAPNSVYLAHLWGGPRFDRQIMELTVDKRVLISYEDSVAEMKAARWQGAFLLTFLLGFGIWQFMRNARKHAFAQEPAS